MVISGVAIVGIVRCVAIVDRIALSCDAGGIFCWYLVRGARGPARLRWGARLPNQRRADYKNGFVDLDGI